MHTAPQQPLKILAPQTYLKLVEDHPKQGPTKWYLSNDMTGEFIDLNALQVSAEWELELNDNGLAVLYDADGIGQWAMDKFKAHIYENGEGIKFMRMAEEGEIFSMQQVIGQHELLKISLTTKLHDATLIVDTAVMKSNLGFGRIWVSITDLWAKCKWDFAPGTGAKWFQCRASRWHKAAEKFGFGKSAVRRSLPYSSQQAVADDRHLTFCSVSLSLLLWQAIVGAHATHRHGGQLDKAEARADLEAITNKLLGMVKPQTVFQLRLDHNFTRLAFLPMGNYAAELQVGENGICTFLGLQWPDMPMPMRREVAIMKVERKNAYK